MSEDRKLTRSARFGFVLFTIYVLLYAGFIGLTVFSPATMSRIGAGGVNNAVGYGFALILWAFILAILYMLSCRD